MWVVGRLWRGPSLLLSAVRTVECVCKLRDGKELEYFGAPVTMYHGTEDEIQRIAGVREEVRLNIGRASGLHTSLLPGVGCWLVKHATLCVVVRGPGSCCARICAAD